MADSKEEDLSRSNFEWVNLTGARFYASEIIDAEFRAVEFNRVKMSGVWFADVAIDGEIENLTINGVDIGPLVQAELDRRYPERAKMRPTDPAGFREAWDIVERLWGETVERARRFDPELLNESVDGEWSFIETLRHLVMATDSWVKRAILGDPAPWHPLGLPWEEAPDSMGLPRDLEARPSLGEVLEIRRDRMATVREVIEGLTDESLNADTEPVQAPGWPPPESFPVRKCLSVILNEEWEHRLFAERDLNALEARAT